MATPARKYQKEKMMRRKEEKQEEPEGPKYRDRAKERRDDQNPDYEPTELGQFHAVAPPGTADLRIADAHKISIENSKYLGGDVEHTHLVKGLDYALLHKVRSEIDKKPDAEDEKDGTPRWSFSKVVPFGSQNPPMFLVVPNGVNSAIYCHVGDFNSRELNPQDSTSRL